MQVQAEGTMVAVGHQPGEWTRPGAPTAALLQERLADADVAAFAVGTLGQPRRRVLGGGWLVVGGERDVVLHALMMRRWRLLVDSRWLARDGGIDQLQGPDASANASAMRSPDPDLLP